MAMAEPLLIARVQAMFTDLPSLRQLSVRDQDHGFELSGESGIISAPREVASWLAG